MTKISTKDWRNLPIDKWNITTFTQFIVDRTEEIYGVEYTPGGGGSKNQRWIREKSMMKQAQTKYGNEVLRRFLDVCWREYKTTPQYTYLSFTFAYAYLDRNFTVAQAEIERLAHVAHTEEQSQDLTDWL